MNAHTHTHTKHIHTHTSTHIHTHTCTNKKIKNLTAGPNIHNCEVCETWFARFFYSGLCVTCLLGMLCHADQVWDVSSTKRNGEVRHSALHLGETPGPGHQGVQPSVGHPARLQGWPDPKRHHFQGGLQGILQELWRGLSIIFLMHRSCCFFYESYLCLCLFSFVCFVSVPCFLFQFLFVCSTDSSIVVARAYNSQAQHRKHTEFINITEINYLVKNQQEKERGSFLLSG